MLMLIIFFLLMAMLAAKLSMLMLAIMSMMDELILKILDSYHNGQLRYDNLSLLVPMLILMMSLLVVIFMAMLFAIMLIRLATMDALILKISDSITRDS